MARRKKDTVDYFPHQCKRGKTLFILEQRFGNDGYAFWFKLLELLGSAPGHYLVFTDRNSPEWEFLLAITHLSSDSCGRLLDLLSRLGAIDAELWEYGVIWSQNFVDGISDVYRNRKVETPPRPSFYTQKPRHADVSTGDNPENDTSACISTPENTQSKVKESKVEKKKKVYKKKKFTPPTLEEVKKYCKSRNNDVDPKQFFDFCKTADWVDSKGQKVLSWKQKVITWEGGNNSRKPARSSTKPWVGGDYASKIHF